MAWPVQAKAKLLFQSQREVLHKLNGHPVHSHIYLVPQQWYAQSFIELCAFEGLRGDRDDLKDYVNTLAVIAKRHVNAVQTMAQGGGSYSVGNSLARVLA